MLLDAQRMEIVGRLAAGVAHDFNNILTVIVGSAEILKLDCDEQGSPNDTVTEHADFIIEASDRATDLTRQLMTFSKPNEGKARVLDLNEVVRNLEKFLARLIGDDIDLGMSLASQGAIRADKGHIEQVITNLVVNARDAMPEGGQLLIGTQRIGEWLELRVVDSGTGMPPEVAAHIFEPFFTTKAQDKGTGLGLATVYGIVKNYGGTVEINSTVGVGTEMLVRLPVTTDSPAEVPVREARAENATGRTILVVEDDARILRLVQGILLSSGYEVIPVSNGTDALEKIDDTSSEIDLLLTDIMMPDLNGTEVASRMAEQRPAARILLMTGYADAQTLEKATAAGRAVINKPFKPDELLRRLEELLN